MSIVVDASAIVPLAMADEDSRYSEAVLEFIQEQGAVFAPPIFLDELQNVLLSAERRKRIAQDVSESFLRRVIEEFPFQENPILDRLQVMDLARKTDLSFYDATYLALAKEEGIPVATLDSKLSQAAQAIGVNVFAGK